MKFRNNFRQKRNTHLQIKSGVHPEAYASACLKAYRKKIYPAHFVAKVTDSDMENSETSGWLDFAVACKYINNEQFKYFIEQNAEVGKLLYHMINNPDKY